jgi:ADP-ribose pyrophosphatase YjhB (NUDIX family)
MIDSPNNKARYLKWATALQALAQNGLTFASTPFDTERYHAIMCLAAEIASECSDFSPDEVLNIFFEDTLYKTPNLDVRAAIFNDDRILLVQENNGLWTLPGGWADVNESPSSNVEREVLEETGLVVKAIKMIALFDKLKHKHPPEWPHAYKCFFLCDIQSGEFKTSIETQAVAFFSLHNLPPLCPNRITLDQIERCYAHYQMRTLATEFD